MNANISSFESFATLDGSGIRFQIFFQGCPLRCNYCHNPETWEENIQKQTYTKEELLEKVLRFKPYFGTNGGVTFSGGEPLLQCEFLIEFSKLLKHNGINIALDTSGAILNDSVKELLTYVDYVILDLKHTTEEEYKKHSNGSLEQTLKFLSYLNSIYKKTCLRTVIVPGYNDTPQKIEEYAKHFKDFRCVSKFELLSYHTLGNSKYDQLKITNKLKDTPALSEEKRLELQKYANKLLTK